MAAVAPELPAVSKTANPGLLHSMQIPDVVPAQEQRGMTYHAHYLHGLASRSQEQYPQALRAFDRAIRKLEQLRCHLMVEFRADFLADKQEIYQDTVDLCLQLKRPRRALSYAERAKSRVLQEMLAHRLDLGIHAHHDSDRPLVDEINQLRQQRNYLCRYHSSTLVPNQRSKSAGRQPEPAQQELAAVEEHITALWHKLLAHNSGPLNAPEVYRMQTAQVQPHLGADTLLVEYYVIHDQIIVFLVTRDDVWVQRLSVELGRVQQLAQLWQLNLRSVPHCASDKLAGLTVNAQGLLRQLYQSLVAPFIDMLHGYSRLIFVPHGVLHSLPLHAFYDGQRYLCERYQISYLPGASVLSFCRSVTPTSDRMLAMGYSQHGQLRHTLTEAHAVANLFGARVLCEERATCAALQADSAGYRLLHLATHADFRPDNPLFSGLELADGWLTTLDIFNLRLNASLVTLSACRTGRNVVGGGDELLGLMRAFLHAGCASLLLCQWAVEDHSTARLMEIFYRILATGANKDCALQAAQYQLMRTVNAQGDLEDAHPYFWASFFLVGDAGAL